MDGPNPRPYPQSPATHVCSPSQIAFDVSISSKLINFLRIPRPISKMLAVLERWIQAPHFPSFISFYVQLEISRKHLPRFCSWAARRLVCFKIVGWFIVLSCVYCHTQTHTNRNDRLLLHYYRLINTMKSDERVAVMQIPKIYSISNVP